MYGACKMSAVRSDCIILTFSIPHSSLRAVGEHHVGFEKTNFVLGQYLVLRSGTKILSKVQVE